MATKYIDQRLTTGLNDGTSAANAFWSIADYFAGSTPAAGDTVSFVAGSGTYYELFHQTKQTGWLSGCTLSGNTIVKAGYDFTAANHPVANDYIRLMGTSLNDGIYRVSSTAVGTLTLTTNLIASESPTRCRVAAIGTTSSTSFPIEGNGSSGNPVIFDFNFCELNGGIVIDSNYLWVQSSGGTNEWYLVKANSTDPMFATGGEVVSGSRGCMTVDGEFRNYSSSDTDFPYHTLGTVGSLLAGQWGVGNNDTLGFNTIYYRPKADAAQDPNDSSIVVAVNRYGLDTNYTYLRFKNINFSYNSEGGYRARGIGWEFITGVAKYMGNQWAESNGSAATALNRNIISYWCGHRDYVLSSTGASASITAQNCIGYNSHLFALLGTGAVGTMTLQNCIGAYQSAGAIDKIAAGATLTENNNHWYPRFTHTGAKLGYNSTANWTTTGTYDHPISTATTLASNTTLLSPAFVRVSDYGIERCDFHLGGGSPCVGAGTPISGFTTDYDGDTYSASYPNQGVYQNVGANGSGNFGGSGGGGLIGSIIS